MENPSNILYILAIASPLVLYPLFLLIRTRYPSLATIVLYVAVTFTIVDMLIMSKDYNYAEAIKQAFQTGPGLYWLVSNVLGILLIVRLQKPFEISLENRWNVVYMFVASLVCYLAGLLLYVVGQNLWTIIQVAANLR